jgi:WD40 repeat protein
LLSFTFKRNDAPPPSLGDQLVTHRWPLDGGEPEHLGSFFVTRTQSFIPADVSRGLFVVASGNELHLHRLESLGARPPRIIFRHPGTLEGAGGPVFDASRERMALCDAEGRLYVWRTDNGDEPLVLEAPPGDPMPTAFSPDGSLLAQASDPLGGVLWDLRGPAGAEPLSLNGNARFALAFAPDGRWLATTAGTHPLALWPMTEKYCRILRGHDGEIANIEFAHDGSRLFTQGQTDGTVLAWPLTGNGRQGPVVVHRTGPAFGLGIAEDPRGRFLIVGTEEKSWRVPLDGGPPVPLGVMSSLPSLDGNGRLLAAQPDHRSPIVGVLDLETGRRWDLDGPGEGDAASWYFDRDGRLLVQRGGVLSRWDPATATAETLFEDVAYSFPHPDGRIFIMSEGTWWLVNLEDGSRTEFSLHGEPGTWDIDPTGEIIAAGSRDGSALVWSISEQKPHILLGHEGRVYESRVSPDGKWVATHGADQTVRLWPVPDLSKPSLHILPLRELLAKLKTLTNLRVMPDETSYTGYKIEPDFTAYRGWETVPTW